MDNKTHQRILAVTHSLIIRYGISSVTMDIIAKECKVSKRTLYETFTDKVSLIKAVLDWHRLKMNEKLTYISNNSKNTLDALLNGITLIRESMEGTSEVFFREINDNFSPAKEECAMIESQLIDGLAYHFAKGQEEGIFLSHYDPRAIAKIFIYSAFDIRMTYEKLGNISGVLDYLDVMRECFIRGIVTPKGLEYYNEFYNEGKK